MQNKKVLIINNENNKSVKNLQKKLFNTIIDQLKYSINFNQQNYTEEILKTIAKILKTTIDSDSLVDFDIYSDKLKEFFDFSASQRKVIYSVKVITLYKEIIYYIFKKNKLDDWLEKIRDKINFFAFNTSEIYTHEDLLKKVYELYYFFLEEIIDRNDIELYEEVSEELLNFVKRTLPNVNNTTVKYLKIFNVIHTKKLIEIKNNKLVKKHLEFLKVIGEYGFEYENDDIYRFILAGFDYIIEGYEEKEIKDLVNKYKFEFVLKALENKDGTATVFIPNYEKMLNDKRKDEDIIEKIIDGFSNLLRRTLITKNKFVSLYLFSRLNQVIMLYEKDDRKEQEMFLNLYEELLLFGVLNKDTENFHLILKNYKELFFELDKEDKMSKKLFMKFIDIYKDMNKIAIEERLIDFSLSINRHIFEMAKESKLALKKSELLKHLHNKLFLIGVKGVENQIDEIIKNISNKLGWLGKEAINNERNDILKNITEKAVSLINLCHDLKIDEGTTIFNGTLFIILGGYAVHRKNEGAIGILKKEASKIKCPEKLYSSKLIRNYESEHWDDLMGGDASKCMNLFYKKLNIKSAC